MSLVERFKNSLQAFSAPTKNSMGTDLGKQFLRYGSGKPLVQDWSQVVMRDEDLYTGYSYGAIRNRANAIAQLATNNLMTDATKPVMMAAKKKGEDLKHPYFEIIDESNTFDDYTFWKNISVFLDLEGVYYLMAIRNVEGGRIGKIQEFKMLNPFEVRRIRNKETMEIGGYTETRDGMVRNIPPDMIIEMRDLNPFSHDEPYSMGDALRDSQFTMKTAGDYTRHSIRNNINSPGAISTDVLLDPAAFENFKSRIVNHEKGEPLFGNGSGAINYQDMQIDLNNAALDKVSDMSLNQIIGVSGNSKTMFGIEQSGVTRDTARVQQELFIANHGIPQLQLIIAALNQDYKKYYAQEYRTNKYRIYIDSPLGVDRDAEKLDIDIRSSSLELYQTLVNRGYDRGIAAKYANGEITLDELGEPTNEPVTTSATTSTDTTTTPDSIINPETKNDMGGVHKVNMPIVASGSTIDGHTTHTHDTPPSIRNAFSDDEQRNLNNQEASLRNRIVNIQEKLVVAVINKVNKNTFDEQSDIVSADAKQEAQNDLEDALAIFYGIIVPLYANTVMRRRAAEFKLQGSFSLDQKAKNFIKENAKKASESHIETILNDLLNAVRLAELTEGGLGDLPIVIQTQYPQETTETVRAALKLAAGSGAKSTDEIVSGLKEIYPKIDDEPLLFKAVRSAALDGASQQQLASSIKNIYTKIADDRAKLIATTETNRAFSRSQYEADREFLEQNNLTNRAYKKWVTRSDNPCGWCVEMSNRAPVPFTNDFVKLGGSVKYTYQKQDGTTSVRTLPVDYEALSYGNAHPRCHCIYILIVE